MSKSLTLISSGNTYSSSAIPEFFLFIASGLDCTVAIRVTVLGNLIYKRVRLNSFHQIRPLIFFSVDSKLIGILETRVPGSLLSKTMRCGSFSS